MFIFEATAEHAEFELHLQHALNAAQRQADSQLQEAQRQADLKLQEAQRQADLKLQRARTKAHQRESYILSQYVTVGQRWVLELFFQDAEEFMFRHHYITRHLKRMNAINRSVVDHWETLRQRFHFRATRFPTFENLLYGKISEQIHHPHENFVMVQKCEDQDYKIFFESLSFRYGCKYFELDHEAAAAHQLT